MGLFLAVLVLGLVGAACGGGSESELERAEAAYKEIREQTEAANAKAEKASDKYLAASEVASELLEEQLNAISASNMTKYHELQAATKAAQANANKLLRESEETPYASKKLRAREEALATRIESLKGCDAACRQERKIAVEKSSECELSMMRANISFKKAHAICSSRYPIPRENILHLQGEEE